jgi:hypothetical protein
MKLSLFIIVISKDKPRNPQHLQIIAALDAPTVLNALAAEPWCPPAIRVMNYNWKLRPSLAREFLSS